MSDSRPSTVERLASVETELVSIKENQAAEKDKLEELEAKLDAITLELTKYKGMIGGMILLVSCVAAFFKSLPFVSSFFK